MIHRASPVATALCVALFLTACQGTSGRDATAADSNAPVAELGGSTVTMAELDAFIKDVLFERETSGGEPSKLYNLRSRSLSDLIDTRLIEEEAERRGLTRDELGEIIAQQAEAISDEEVSEFFEKNKGRFDKATFEQVAPRIREALERQRGTVELEEFVASLRKRAGVTILLEPARVEVAADGPSKGPAGARVTIVEFSDFQCPFCSRALPVLDEVLERYPDDVRLVYRHMPLDRIHAHARSAAEASVCAQDQGRFWPFHDLLFANPRNLGPADLERYASEVGLDLEPFRACVAERKFREKVEADSDAARTIGVSGTPAFVVNGIVLTGARPLPDFVRIIDAELTRLGDPAESS
jgi:protein-disulfide isomerase